MEQPAFRGNRQFCPQGRASQYQLLQNVQGSQDGSFRHEKTALSIHGNITEEGTHREKNILLVFGGRGSTVVLWILLKRRNSLRKQLSKVSQLNTYLHKYNHEYIRFALFYLLNCKHVINCNVILLYQYSIKSLLFSLFSTSRYLDCFSIFIIVKNNPMNILQLNHYAYPYFPRMNFKQWNF